MNIIEAVTLALIQGLTEFLPISSSGHLILGPEFLGWDDQGLGFDISVHLGTLAAVIAYFRRELIAMTRDLFVSGSPAGRLARRLIIASLPLGVAGIVSADLVASILRTPIVIAIASAGFGLLLWATDRWMRGQRDERDLRIKDALIIGVGQSLALIPGTSRSGITMTMALALGLTREAASRFSFLMAVPAIGMAASWQIVKFARAPEAVHPGLIATGVLVSMLIAFVAIALFLRLIESIGMWVFAVYRVVLAGIIVYVLV